MVYFALGQQNELISVEKRLSISTRSLGSRLTFQFYHLHQLTRLSSLFLVSFSNAAFNCFNPFRTQQDSKNIDNYSSLGSLMQNSKSILPASRTNTVTCNLFAPCFSANKKLEINFPIILRASLRRSSSHDSDALRTLQPALLSPLMLPLCNAPKIILSFPLIFFPLVSFFFYFLFNSFVFSFFFFSSFNYFSTTQNPPSKRANFNSVRFAFSVNTSEAAQLGFAEGGFAAVHPLTPVYILGTLPFYYGYCLFYINFGPDRFSVTGILFSAPFTCSLHAKGISVFLFYFQFRLSYCVSFVRVAVSQLLHLRNRLHSSLHELF